jgi:hypothetical protein
MKTNPVNPERGALLSVISYLICSSDIIATI